jgi:hypothetical protein
MVIVARDVQSGPWRTAVRYTNLTGVTEVAVLLDFSGLGTGRTGEEGATGGCDRV